MEDWLHATDKDFFKARLKSPQFIAELQDIDGSFLLCLDSRFFSYFEIRVLACVKFTAQVRIRVIRVRVRDRVRVRARVRFQLRVLGLGGRG
jgi:hypothetical protein